MLIAFKLRNFRSFSGEQTLTYMTSPDRAHESTHCIKTGLKAVPRLSRCALVIGPNAGGKTNLLIALGVMRDLVLNSTSFTDAQFAERYTPFQLGPSRQRPTDFEIDVLFGGVRFRYAMSFNAHRIVCERLLAYRTGKSQRWFERRYDPVKQVENWTPFSPSFTGPREMWRKATRSKALFLTTAAQLNAEHVQPLFHWFEHCLEVVFPHSIPDLGEVANRIQDADFKSRALSLFRSADIPINDLRVAEHEQAHADSASGRSGGNGHTARSVARRPIEFLHAAHGKHAAWLDASVEAAGTHRLLRLLGPLLSTIEKGKFLAMDEFDTSLHPLLARFLIELINFPSVASSNAQLLLTSHNATLMDLDILRRDEIWLLELDDAYASKLSPLLKSSPRKHEMVGKGYLRGRYGAIPKIDSDFFVNSQPTNGSAEKELH